MPEPILDYTKFKEGRGEFIGVIINADYGEAPLGIAGRPEFQTLRDGTARKQIAFEIKVISGLETEKTQKQLLAPSDVKYSKMYYWVRALNETGAVKDVEVKGLTEDEKWLSFAKSHIGMQFRFEEKVDLEGVGYETDATGKPLFDEHGRRVKRKIRMLVPVEYFGKVNLEELEKKVETEKISEVD
jgi:hypothetical protein